MDKIARFQQWWQTALTVSGAALVALLLRWVWNQIGSVQSAESSGADANSFYVYSLLLIVFFVPFLHMFIQIGRWLLSAVLERSRALRRFLSGKSFIEGMWVDVVIDKGSMEIVRAAVLMIRYEDGNLKVSGEVYDRQSRLLGNFSSIHTYYSNFRLRYTYRTHLLDKVRVPVAIGYGELHFVKSPKIPNTFSGFFLDGAESTGLQCVGVRLTQKQERKLVRSHGSTPGALEERQKTAKQFIERYENLGLPELEPDFDSGKPQAAGKPRQRGRKTGA